MARTSLTAASWLQSHRKRRMANRWPCYGWHQQRLASQCNMIRTVETALIRVKYAFNFTQIYLFKFYNFTHQICLSYMICYCINTHWKCSINSCFNACALLIFSSIVSAAPPASKMAAPIPDSTDNSSRITWGELPCDDMTNSPRLECWHDVNFHVTLKVKVTTAAAASKNTFDTITALPFNAYFVVIISS